MHRLRDYWNHKATEAAFHGCEIEPYEVWLERIGVTEEADDEGAYGDENPWWLGLPPKIIKERIFRVWEDGGDFEMHIQAKSMREALNEAARRLGAIDYADLAQRRKWDENEGLNIAEVDDASVSNK